MSLEIVRLLGIVAFQDAPIQARRRYGVPPGGPFDMESAALANALVGNPPGTAVLELSNAVLTLKATQAHMLSCVGPPVGIQVSGREIPDQSTFLVSVGQAVEFSAPRTGARAYLAIPGGWSKGTIAVGRMLSPCGPANFRLRVARLEEPPRSLRTVALRYVPGPQADSFPDGALDVRWTVSPAADRVGIRLIGKAIDVSGELPSEPACPGAVQVTNDGQLVILGPDGPTIGGYPKIAVVCSADLDRLGQLRPRDAISFERITLEEAQAVLAESELSLAGRLGRLRVAVSNG